MSGSIAVLLILVCIPICKNNRFFLFFPKYEVSNVSVVQITNDEKGLIVLLKNIARTT